jgi:hypothetical protein
MARFSGRLGVPAGPASGGPIDSGHAFFLRQTNDDGIDDAGRRIDGACRYAGLSTTAASILMPISRLCTGLP